MRFFLDHCVSKSVMQALQESGHEALRLKSHLPTDAPDQQVINKAQELDSILVSLNGDFSDIVTYPPANFGGIVSLQIKNHPEVTKHVVDRLLAYLADEPHREHYAGKLLLVEPHRIRVRR